MGRQSGTDQDSNARHGRHSSSEDPQRSTKDFKTGEMKSKCVFCQLLCEVFDSFFGFETDRWDHNVMNGSPFKVRFMIKQGHPPIVSCLDFEWDSSIYTSRVDLELYCDEAIVQSPDAPCIGPAGIRAIDSSSGHCMSFVQDCVAECQQSHVPCRTTAGSFVPTRLLHIGNSDEELFICESAAGSATGTLSAWAALSHCWGGGQPVKLTKDSISDLHYKVYYDTLPPTFKDAIKVARVLGVQYVWIDSLCIIQDDSQDWDREAAMTGMVYSHAFIVISGALSANPNTPFLGPRDENWLPRQFSMTMLAGQTLSINARRRHLLAAPLEQGLHEPPFTQLWAQDRWKGPLYKRAWCFQETHLARRVLHFTPGSIIFECRTHRRAEDQVPPYPHLYSLILGQVSDSTKWRMVVRQYTSRDLTRPTDKLPAISGVASLVPQANRTDYLAGLWRESLLYDLLWNVQPRPKEPLAYRGEGYTAPTWS